MIVNSQLVSRMSGSVGGLNATHNRGGMVLRTKPLPVDPATPLQSVFRARTASLSARWATLSQAQRDAWAVYATNVHLTNRLGKSVNVGAIGHYIRTNHPRMLLDQPVIDQAPAVFDLGGYTPLAFGAFLQLGTQIILVIDGADAWANEDGAYLLCFASRPQNPSVRGMRTSARFAGGIAGDSIAPPGPAVVFTSAYPFVSGQRLFARIAVSRADGRYSADQALTGIATA